ncbi:MAG TPA: PEP-CTERM sorting domain-containing protein, partial [Phycisphaerae bacterium]|nr:PEP-CTERM sorting domain-containing protein [Phycisphaerae bacterium]
SGNLPNAKDIAVQFQPPTVNLPVVTFSGGDFGWDGTGVFTGDIETTLLNEPILDFSAEPPGALALWFLRIVNLDDANPGLGGAFTNAYIEVDLAPVPEPASLTLLACSTGALLLRRRYRVAHDHTHRTR